jgi:hypothetical protein
MTSDRVFWMVWAVAFVAVLLGRFADWLNGGAMAGAIGLLAALAMTQRPGTRGAAESQPVE